MNRVVSVLFGLGAVAFAYYLGRADLPSAMRFLWNTVPLVGIPFLMGVVWRRMNRYGAFASVAASMAASGIGMNVFHWTGDAGLPKNIALFLGAGILAGILVSLATRPDPKARVDAFFLLMDTPIGQESVLHRAGLREIPGTGTFEFPGDLSRIDVERAESGLTDAEAAARRDARRHAITGFIVAGIIVLLILLGGKLVASWLAGG